MKFFMLTLKKEPIKRSGGAWSILQGMGKQEDTVAAPKIRCDSLYIIWKKTITAAWLSVARNVAVR
jgi:hypothetical protein